MKCCVIRSKQGLEEWRNQAKLKQKLKEQDKGELSYVRAMDMAPFATETMKTEEESSRPQPSTIMQDADLLGSKLSLRLDQELVDKYRTKLKEKRQQVGIITVPSSELQEAEKNLAEVSLNI